MFVGGFYENDLLLFTTRQWICNKIIITRWKGYLGIHRRIYETSHPIHFRLFQRVYSKLFFKQEIIKTLTFCPPAQSNESFYNNLHHLLRLLLPPRA